jgi:putative hydrolase of the HAD superfamily
MQHAVLLDALGTLLALEPPAPALRSELASRLGVEISPEQAMDAIAAEIAYYRAHLDDGRDAASLAELRRRCAGVVRDAIPALARAQPDAVHDALLASLRFSLFDDVRPALRSLRSAGARLVVVSNWDVSLHDVLARLGVAELLDGIVTSAEVGSRKPAPEIFAFALSIAGAGPADAVHVGDSLAEDVAGARAAGIEPVLIARAGGANSGEVRVIRTLAEL